MAEAAPRAKSLRKRLQRQLEFYLSESNLRQDKFLRQHMDERGFLAVQLLLSFNKLKALNATERLVLEAAEKSPAIRVDRAAAAIAPIALPPDDDDADERTIYIEGFAFDDDHDSLRKTFSSFGKVNLVSMPRFQQSRKFKGFAFIEFAEASAVGSAVKSAAARDPALKGIRVMTKLRWLALKEQLKAKLAEDGGEHTHNADSQPKVTTKDESQKPLAEGEPRQRKKKRSAHIRFGGSDDSEDSDGAADAQDAIKKSRIE